MVSVCQIDPTNPIMINSTDSLLHHTVPITVSDSFSVIEIREIPEPIVNKHSINGKRVLTGTIILQSKKNKSFFRHNQIFFIRLKKKNTVYGVISIAKKKKGEISRNNNIIPNQSYFFTIKPYNKENIIPNEKIAQEVNDIIKGQKILNFMTLSTYRISTIYKNIHNTLCKLNCILNFCFSWNKIYKRSF